ncbi:uncharacterized protein [Rutidosis leptorrhynchoides]|uniref:uncharacterized protein n=1 Tax=Rutidosis leptorrhynchoides TaxID=125765 RepID=UPI003A98D30E
MEGLHLCLKEKVDVGAIHGASIGDTEVKVSHLFYADNVVILSYWNGDSLSSTILAVNEFYRYSGDFHFTYLGLLIGSNMNLISNWKTLVDKFMKKLSFWKANLLSIGGHLTLIKAVLESLGIYFLSMFNCPELVLNNLERCRANFFWGGSESDRKIHWISWNQAFASYDKGDWSEWNLWFDNWRERMEMKTRLFVIVAATVGLLVEAKLMYLGTLGFLNYCNF